MMDYPTNSTIEETTLAQELGRVRAVIEDIKSHVMEPIPTQVGKEVNPRAMHKVVNLKDDVRQIQRELEEILKAVVLL